MWGRRFMDIMPLVFSGLAILVTGWLARDSFLPGKVRPLLTGYGVIREMPDEGFPSDHLILPIDWENTSVRSRVVRKPFVVLKEVVTNGKELRFLLGGEYPTISSKAFTEEYNRKSSFMVEPRSITSKVLVFHIENWWDEDNDFYRFRFNSGESYKVYIGFYENTKLRMEEMGLTLKVYATLDRLDRSTSYWWDYFTFEEPHAP